MVCCLGLLPLDANRTVPRTLYASIVKLEGHPLIESLYVDDYVVSRGNGIRIRVTVVPDADSTRYGFRDTDTLQRYNSGTGVCVTRGEGVFFLTAIIYHWYPSFDLGHDP